MTIEMEQIDLNGIIFRNNSKTGWESFKSISDFVEDSKNFSFVHNDKYGILLDKLTNEISIYKIKEKVICECCGQEIKKNEN